MNREELLTVTAICGTVLLIVGTLAALALMVV